MLSAFSRLFLIAAGAILWIAFALVAIRHLGGGQNYADSDHPLMKEKTWIIYDISTSPAISQLPDQVHADLLKEIPAAQLSQVILKLPVRLSNDGVWVVSNRDYVTFATGEVKPIIAASLKEIEPLGVHSIETWVNAFETASAFGLKGIYFYSLDPSAGQLEQLSEFVKKKPHLKDRVLFASPYARGNQEMRKIEPLWLYGASTTDISKLRFFTSLYIEPVATSNADFVEFISVPHPRLVEELNHRKRRVLFFLKNESSLEKLPPALGGWVISEPTLLSKRVALEAATH